MDSLLVPHFLELQVKHYFERMANISIAYFLDLSAKSHLESFLTCAMQGAATCHDRLPEASSNYHAAVPARDPPAVLPSDKS